MTVFKEFLIYLRNTKQSSALLRYIDKIQPLDIDAALMNEYISELASGNVPGSLIDEVETLYEENEYSIDRVRDVNAIGDVCVDFDIGDVFDCIQKIEDVIWGRVSVEAFMSDFSEYIAKIDNDDISATFSDVLDLCNDFSAQQISKDYFIDSLREILSDLNDTYRF